MDWRERNYYLVRINDNWFKDMWMHGYDGYGILYDRNLSALKYNCPSLKLHAPYCHFPYDYKKPILPNTERRFGLETAWDDGVVSDKTGVVHPHFMASCLISDSPKLETVLEELDKTTWCKLSKELCGQ